MTDLRVKYEDIKGKEQLFFECLDEISNSIPRKINLLIWHNGSDLSKLKHLVQSTDINPIQIKFSDQTPDRYYVWFDIVNHKDNKKYSLRSRFKVLLSNQKELGSALFSFRNVLNYLHEMPNRKYKMESKKNENRYSRK